MVFFIGHRAGWRSPERFFNHKTFGEAPSSLIQREMFKMENHKTGLIVLILLAVTAFGNGAASPDNRPGPVVTSPDLNSNGTDIANLTVPAEFRANPQPVRLEVTVPDTFIPGPKGEMQAGPRSIGFTVTPILFLITALAAILLVAGSWLVLKRKSAEGETEKTGEDAERHED